MPPASPCPKQSVESAPTPSASCGPGSTLRDLDDMASDGRAAGVESDGAMASKAFI